MMQEVSLLLLKMLKLNRISSNHKPQPSLLRLDQHSPALVDANSQDHQFPLLVQRGVNRATI
ncbi:MAG: hypothetical protein ACREPR_10115 [Brasilonema sp.]